MDTTYSKNNNMLKLPVKFLQNQHQAHSDSIHNWTPALTWEHHPHLCVFVPLGQLLFRRQVWSLGRCSIDRVFQAIGFLPGAAGGTGWQVSAQRCRDRAAGWWRRRHCFNWRFFRMARAQTQRNKNRTIYFTFFCTSDSVLMVAGMLLTWANNRDWHALVLSRWCHAGCWRAIHKKLLGRADAAKYSEDYILASYHVFESSH